MIKLFVTAAKRISFTLGVGRKAYNTRDIAGPAASKPPAQCSLAVQHELQELDELAQEAPPPSTSTKAEKLDKARKRREQEWLSRPAMARYLGLGKKKFQELLDGGYIPHRNYPPKDTLRFNVQKVEKALARFDVEAHS